MRDGLCFISLVLCHLNVVVQAVLATVSKNGRKAQGFRSGRLLRTSAGSAYC